MPCTLQPWEIEFENRQANKRKYGIDVSDIALVTGLLCEACHLIEEKDMSPTLKKWWKAHQNLDKEYENE